MKKERDPELVAIGQRVRNARINRGMTKEALAEAADTSTQFLSQIEKGEQSMTIIKFKRLALALGVSTDYLIFGRERMSDREALAAEYMAGMKPVDRDFLSRMLISMQGLMDAVGPEPNDR